MSVSNFFRGWWGSEGADSPPPELNDTMDKDLPSLPDEEQSLEQLLERLKLEAQKPLDEAISTHQLVDLVMQVEQNTEHIKQKIDKEIKDRDTLSIHILDNYDQVHLNKLQDVMDGKYHLMMTGGDDFGQELFYADGSWIYGSEKTGSGTCYSYLTLPGSSEERANKMVMTMFLDPRTTLRPFDWEKLMEEWKEHGYHDTDLHFTEENDIYFVSDDGEIYIKHEGGEYSHSVTGNVNNMGRFVLDRVLYPECWSWEPSIST